VNIAEVLLVAESPSNGVPCPGSVDINPDKDKSIRGRLILVAAWKDAVVSVRLEARFHPFKPMAFSGDLEQA